jgi:hypothetical protein
MGEFRQVWHGYTDLGYMLSEITGWMVKCPNHNEHKSAVILAEENGWVGRRTHYAPAFPEGVEAFEITDAGIAKLNDWGRSGDAAKKTRQWYRDNASKPFVSQAPD